MTPVELYSRFVETIGRLEKPQIMLIFLGFTAIAFYTVHHIGRKHLKKDIHKLVNLAISIIIGLILVMISTGLGLL
jgi:hypothetical protein